MDDKKNTLSEETKGISPEEVIEVVGFDDIKSALSKLDAKQEQLEKEKKEEAAKQSDEQKKETASVKVDDEKKDEKSVDASLDTSKGNSDKKTDLDEKKESDEKKLSDEKKELDEKKTSDEKKELDEKKTSDEKKESDEKKTSDEKKESDEKKSSDDKKSSDEKDATPTNKDSGKALTQSKRLADAKAASAAKAEAESAVTTTPKKEKKKGKGIAVFFGVLVVLVLAAYVGGVVYFSNYFYPDVAINGVDVSNMDQAAAKKTLDDFNKNYTLTLDTIDGKQVVIQGADIAMEIKLKDEFGKCLKEQEPYMWFVNLGNHHDYVIAADATWDAEKLESLYADMKMLDKKYMTAPKDAYIGMEDGKFTIVKEELGTTLDVDTFKKVVDNCLASVVASANLKDLECYELPSIYDTDDSLANDLAAMGDYANGVITLQLDDLTLEPGMELYDAVLEKDGDGYTVSKTKVAKYVKSLADQYDTMGKERTFTTSFDDRVIKISGTAFGYEMDQEATTTALYNALNEKKAATVEVVFKTKGRTLQGENDIGDTYIEVNLSEQYVVGYKDGKKVVEGDCVSGCEANGNGTCLGLYVIQDKLSPTVLRGQQVEVTETVTKKNKKGKKVKVKKTKMEYEYESPVTYWLQFNGGYGLHDAAGWRSSYGGSIYYYNGSHGCVNLPLDVAEKLYEVFQLDDPVLVYFWDNENRK
ncbi:MAG: L,D-transpeptidase family protein [Lachnospiraceae bacterium]|nr:L,D-transpeptidase family protein [Lachnospiraceae bacterium]